MTAHYDVAIVGAGPAGSWAAYRLARQGARVALVDGSHPREKPCGGGVTGRALDLVRGAIDFSAMTAVQIDTATFISRGRTASMRLDDADGCALSVVARRTFDAALVHAAGSAGAAIVRARATSVARTNGGWTIVTPDGGISSAWLIGADGANSLVRRRVFRPFARADLSIGAGYFVHGLSSREITIVFEHDPPGYLWSFPRADHLAVGVGAQADESSSAVLLAMAAQWIERHAGDARVRLERYSWPIPSLGERAVAQEQPAGARWMLAGDAAGLVDPITREGIFFALASGEAAAESLAHSDPARTYAARIHDEIYQELLRAARLKSRFFQPRFTTLLVHALQRSARIRAVMLDLVAGRQSYRDLRRRLLGTFELKLMWEMVRT